MDDVADRLIRAQITTLYKHAEAGHFTLPEEMHKALRAEVFVRDQVVEARAELQRTAMTGEVVHDMALEVVQAAREGKPLPDFAGRVAKAEQAERLARLRLSIMEDAAHEASRDVTYGTSGEAIIVSHLRPALAATIATVQGVHSKLEGYDVQNPEAILRAPAPVREAFTTLSDASFRYSALRNAQMAASRLAGGPKLDAANWFSEFRDPKALDIPLGGRAGQPMPWPDHPLARLAWIATVGREQVWMPLPSEQDALTQTFFKAVDNRRLSGFVLG